MKLSTLIQNLEIISFHGGDPEIKGLSSNSGQIREGYLFVAIKGEKDDGHRFIEEAIKRGAVAVLVEEDIPLRPDFPAVRVRSSRRALSKLAVRFYDQPSSRLNLVGITGTNGKTTVSYLIKNILKNFGKRLGLLGTINYEIGDRVIPATNTTPDAAVLNSYLQDMVKENTDYAILEVSSHSISQHRIDELDFNTGIFTNFGHDHLDYHHSLENYFQTKKRFFERLPAGAKAIINIDDPRSKEISRGIKARIFSYAVGQEADVFIKSNSLFLSLAGVRFIASGPNGEFPVECPLIGRHNVYNILAAACFCLSEGVPLEIISSSLRNFPPVRGRLQRVDYGQDFILFVDYAHTEEALKSVLTNLRSSMSGGRLITIFGCGGDRDRQKRAAMGKISSELSDVVILTSDNPRSENPQAIIEDIVKGIEKNSSLWVRLADGQAQARYEIISDREEAIKRGIALAQKGDIVLIAGKGHERYQIFRDTVVPFDDVEVARKIILNKTSSPKL